MFPTLALSALVLLRSATCHADVLVPRYANVSSSASRRGTYSLPVVVFQDAAGSTPTSTGNGDGAAADPTPPSIPLQSLATTEQSASTSIVFSFVPGNFSATASSGVTSSRDVLSTSTQIASATATSSASEISSVHFSYVPNGSLSSSSSTTSLLPTLLTTLTVSTRQSTTFLTLYTTIYRTLSGSVPAPANGSSASHTAISYPGADESARDSTTTTTIFTTVFAPQDSGPTSSSGPSSTCTKSSIGTMAASQANPGQQPSATSRAVQSSVSGTRTNSLGSASAGLDSTTVVFSYIPDSATLSHTSHSNPQTDSIAEPYPLSSSPSRTDSSISATKTSRPGGIIIVPVDPNATTVTVTEIEVRPTHTVTETVARLTITATT